MAGRRSEQADTVAETIQRTLVDHRRELAFLGVGFASAFAVLSLLGWSAMDGTWWRPDVRSIAITNPCGPLGANLADLLFLFAGHGAWAVASGLALAVVGLAGRPLPRPGQVALAAWIWLIGLGFLELAAGPAGVVDHRPGGWLGEALAAALTGVVGVVGSWLVLFAAAVSAGSVLLQLSWREAAWVTLDKAEAALPHLKEGARTASGSVASAIGAVAVGVGRWLWLALDALGAWGRASAWWLWCKASEVGAAWATSAFHAARRGWRSLVDSDIDPTDPDEWTKATGMEALPQSDVDVARLVDLALSGAPSGPGTIAGTVGGFGADDPTRVAERGRDAAWDASRPEQPSAVMGRFPSLERRVSEAPERTMTTSPRMMLEGTPRRAPRAPVAHVEVVDEDDAPEPVVLSSVVPARSSEPVAARREAVVSRPEPVVSRPEPVAARGEPMAAGGAPSFVVHAPAARRPEAVDELGDADEDTDGSVDPVDEWESSEDDSLPGVRAASPSDEVKVGAAEGLQRTVRDDGRAVSDQANLFFELPPLSLLDPVPEQRATIDEEDLRRLAVTVEESLASFKVTGKVQNVRVGPVVTTFEFLPDTGISVRRISALQDDLAMALRAISVRVVAPIPGKGVVGIEIPSAQRMTIYLRELLASEEFRTFQAALPVILGKDVEGRPLVADLARMPHLLVGGTTGSGKSVGVNGMLMSLLYRRTPEELRLLLVDPKKLEFESYADVPHLLHPVVTEPKAAAAALAWACREMDRRYELLARWGTRNIANYNKKVEREVKTWSRDKAQQYAPKDWPDDVPPPKPELLPYIVIVIDELADLMMVARKDVEGSVVRLAQMARACGMHLVVATQRPSVDVITGLIKSNLPTRVSFKLRSVIDSRTILDQGGAEKLLGQGDMLHLPGSGEIQRAHGPFVSDDEVSRVIDFLKAQREPDYIDAITADDDGAESEVEPEAEDDLYAEAVAIVVKHGKASTSMIQRHLKIGYNRAARIVDLMEMAGVVGPADGARPREVIGGHHG